MFRGAKRGKVLRISLTAVYPLPGAPVPFLHLGFLSFLIPLSTRSAHHARRTDPPQAGEMKSLLAFFRIATHAHYDKMS